jgi:hypothetical protein
MFPLNVPNVLVVSGADYFLNVRRRLEEARTV